VGSSAVTRILFTLAAILGLIATTTLPTGSDPRIGMWAASLSVLFLGCAGVVHAIWDHGG